jgi:hypothetical protein
LALSLVVTGQRTIAQQSPSDPPSACRPVPIRGSYSRPEQRLGLGAGGRLLSQPTDETWELHAGRDNIKGI